MESLFTRAEVFKIIGWVMAIIVPLILYRWNSKELKESERKQEKRIDRLWKKILDEITARKDSEKKIAEENAKRWNDLYQQEKKNREMHCKKTAEREKEIRDLRIQLYKKGVLFEEQDISDGRRRKEVILIVKRRWQTQSKNGKINGLTIKEFLGEGWENNFDNRLGEDILKERNWLIKKIDNETQISKKINLT